MLPLLLLCACPLLPGVFPSEIHPFPLLAGGGAVLHPDAAGLAALASAGSSARLEFPWQGEAVVLELTRVSTAAIASGFRVDGEFAPALLEGIELSVWSGQVLGEADSDAFLAFSRLGSRGWVRRAEGLVHVLSEPDAVLGWDRPRSSLRSDEDLNRELEQSAAQGLASASAGMADFCQVAAHPSALPTALGPQALVSAVPGTGIYAASLAIETDYQLFQAFGNDAQAEAAYVTALLATVADRWLGQLGTELTFPYVQFYTAPGDPWSSPDGGGGVVPLFIEMLVNWSGNLPVPANVAHFLSGSLSGGVARAGVLCDALNEVSFGVTGLNGQTPFPVAQGPLTADFSVLAHELGHSFGTHHTHDYAPTLDACLSGGCTSQGTLMSACNGCPGGFANITTFFHPDVAANLRQDIANCLPLVAGIESPVLGFLEPHVATPVEAFVTGSPVGAVELNYRQGGAGSFSSLAMLDEGAGVWSAPLPAAGCDQEVEFFFSMDDAARGPVESALQSTRAAYTEALFADDFQSDQGWSVGGPGDDAFKGVWERVDPNPTYGQPGAGVNSGAGAFCFVTGQSTPGASGDQNEVEGGKTTLTSPLIDLSGGDAEVSYWRWYYNADISGSDVLLVEITNDGSSWTPVEAIGTPDPVALGGWFQSSFTVSDFVPPSSQVRLRFTAEDEGQSWVTEAAIDDVRVERLSCELCQPDLGFAGPGQAQLSLCGPALTVGASADLLLAATPLTSGLVLYSLTSVPVPVLGGTLIPFPFLGTVGVAIDGSGEAHLPVQGMSSLASSTVYLQAIVAEPGGQITFSNALAAGFLP